jgi:uncharacterized protein YcgI (DUF1989 family)
MPLMMIEPSAPPPAEQIVLVPGGEVRAFSVKQGQLIAITDVEGGQPASLFAIAADDPEHFLSPHHTRVFSNSFVLRLGMRLVTNRRRPAMVLGVSRGHLAHDLLMSVTEGDGADGLRRRVAEALREAGGAPVKIADPINLFLDVEVGRDGALTPRGVSSEAGDTIAMRVVMDMLVAVAAPRADGDLWSRPGPGPLRVQVRNEVAHIQGIQYRG